MTIRLSACVHTKLGSGLLARTACGRSYTRTLRLSDYPDEVTCKSCRVIRGWDPGPEEKLLRMIFPDAKKPYTAPAVRDVKRLPKRFHEVSEPEANASASCATPSEPRRRRR